MTLALRFLHVLAAITWIGGMLFVALLLSALHDFVLGPRAGAPGADPSMRVWASWIARLNVLVVLTVVVLGLALRG